MAKTLPPRYVRAARMYCVTSLGGQVQMKNKVKQEQTVDWFSEEQVAWEFYKSKNG